MSRFKALGRILALTIALMVISACSGLNGSPTLPAPTETADSVSVVSIDQPALPIEEPTQIPPAFPVFPEMVVTTTGISVAPREAGQWPTKVSLTPTSAYALLLCQGRQDTETYVTLSPDGDPLQKFQLISHPKCMGGTLLIISGTQIKYELTWEAKVLNVVSYNGNLLLNATKFEAKLGTTPVNLTISRVP